MPDVPTVSRCAQKISVGSPPAPTSATALGRPRAASSTQLLTPFVASHCCATLAMASSPQPSLGARLGLTDGVRISS
jgi:hypothetical protein